MCVSLSPNAESTVYFPAGDNSYVSSDSALEHQSSEDSDYDTMLRRKSSKAPPGEPEHFMPGMEADKKKKGFFSFFRKKGSAKFKMVSFDVC